MAKIRLIAKDELAELLALYKHLNEDDPVIHPEEIEEHWQQILNDNMMRAIEIAKQYGCYKVMLMTSSRMEGVHDFYGRCGFQKDVKTGSIIKNQGQKS